MREEDLSGFESMLPIEPHRTESKRLRTILAIDPVKTPRLTEFTDASFVSEVMDVKDQLVVFDFWSDACVLCGFMREVTLRLRDDMKAVKFGRVNVTKNPGIVKAFELRAIPHLAAVLNGEVVFEFIGGRTYDEVRKKIEEFAPVAQ